MKRKMISGRFKKIKMNGEQIDHRVQEGMISEEMMTEMMDMSPDRTPRGIETEENRIYTLL